MRLIEVPLILKKTLLAEKHEMVKAEGKTERNFEIAKAMLADGMSVEKIPQLIGLSENEIRELENQLRDK